MFVYIRSADNPPRDGHVQAVPRLSPENRWEVLQPPRNIAEGDTFHSNKINKNLKRIVMPTLEIILTWH